jgi:hypothetical protein
MNDNATSGQEASEPSIEITVCSNGVVNVKHPESERAHSVILGILGDVVHCSCKGHKFRGECSHADAIESRPLVVSSALAAAATYHDPQDSVATADAEAARALATDGGQRVESTESERELPVIVDCDDDPHRARCEGCGASGPKGLGDDGPAILHERDCPRADRGDETDDENGGDGERGTVDVHGCSTCSGYAYGDDDQCAECQQRGVSPVDETPL